MSSKKWFVSILSIILFITPAFTQNRGDPEKNPPGNPPEKSQPNPPELPPEKPDNIPPEKPRDNPFEKPDGPGPHDNRDFYNFRGTRKIVVSDSIEIVSAYVSTSSSSSAPSRNIRRRKS